MLRVSDFVFTVKCSELFEHIPEDLEGLFFGCVYPWEVLPRIGEYLSSLELSDDYIKVREGVYIHKGAVVAESALILPPTVICEGAEVRHGAYIRGKVYVGRGCVVGNSTELKNSIMLDGAKAPHYNYVGDSILGSDSHLGASAIASNLKSDKSEVTVKGDVCYHTGLRKLGAILGDRAEVGCGAVLNPGTVIGKGARVYPNTTVRGVIPEFAIMKSESTVVKIRKAEM